MNAFLEQRIANLMGPEPTYSDPMMMAEGGEVFEVDDDPEFMAESSMAMKSPVTDPNADLRKTCLLYTSPSPRDRQKSRMPSSA